MAVVLGQQFNKAFAVTASDTVNFPFIDSMGRMPDALMVNAAGAVVVVQEDGTAVTLSAAVGIPLFVKAKRVNSTSTTATGISALYAV